MARVKAESVGPLQIAQSVSCAGLDCFAAIRSLAMTMLQMSSLHEPDLPIRMAAADAGWELLPDATPGREEAAYDLYYCPDCVRQGNFRPPLPFVRGDRLFVTPQQFVQVRKAALDAGLSSYGHSGPMPYRELAVILGPDVLRELAAVWPDWGYSHPLHPAGLTDRIRVVVL